MENPDQDLIAVVGLGYVGLPVAVEFAKIRPVLGFDIDQSRIQDLTAGKDRTLEVTSKELATTVQLRFSYEPRDLAEARIYIVTVPTPIDKNRRPNLTPLLQASKTVGAVLKKGDIVIYESTVYPGATEEECVPILERESGLVFNVDFFCGYSPERINPGDKKHRLPNIVKVTSGSTPEIAKKVDALYASIITAGTHMAPSIKVAEAAKVIENTQRDLNIALINELAIIFNRLDIDTKAVLDAAGTKWNFLPFRPGLVGGHCIGVDPYYLTHKAEAVGYRPEVILAGRRLNDGMAKFAANELIKALLKSGQQMQGAKVLLLGLTFKENCPDLRNTKVADLYHELREYGLEVDVHDPWVDPDEALKEYGITMTANPEKGSYSGIILTLAHSSYKEMGSREIRAFGQTGHVFFDLKSVFDQQESDLRL